MEGQLTQVTPENATAAFNAFGIATPDAVDPEANGSVIVRIMPGVPNVQQSNFNDGSFIIENTGDKRIVGVYFDHSTALYQDSVWDPDGTGGDNAFKELQIDSDGGTEVVDPTNANFFQAAQTFTNGVADDPLFRDGVAEGRADGGFRGMLLTFDADAADPDIGFTNGEQVTFSGDMDPNSIAGYSKGTVDGGSQPQWDVGGVSGAELMGTTITILFSDGTTATAQLMSDGSQGGAQALITQDSPETPVSLTVNGVTSDAAGALGGAGVYDETDPMVTVTGTPGDTVRVVLTKGHNPVENPTNNAKQVVEDRLADDPFQANNAAEFQIQDVVLDANGMATVIFEYDDIADSITQPFFGDNTLPLGFMAAVIDPSSGLAQGPVTAPIYLEWNGQDPAMPVANNDFVTVAEGDGAAVIDVLNNDTDANGDPLTIVSVNGSGATGQVILSNGEITYNPNGQFESLAAGETATDSFTYTINDGASGSDSATVTITITGQNDAPDANDDSAGVFANAGDSVIDVLSNDSDVDASDTVTVISVDGSGAAGQVSLVGGQVIYNPNGQFDGLNQGETTTDSFTYTISDGNGGTDTATATITITGPAPGNTAPVAVDDAPAAVSEDSGAFQINVLGNDSDADGDTLSIISIDQTQTAGLVTLENGQISYSPNGQFDGLNDGETATDSFTYTISDGNGGVSTATVTITITGADDTPAPPVFTNGDDTVTGTDADDQFAGRDGDDQISGGAGNDLITGGTGDDTINGDAGADELRGNAGDDIVRGGAGDDQIFGGGGADALFGGDGDDLIVGVTGDDLIFGGAGDDNLFGRADNDTLDGGDGDDRLTGNSGNDVLLGGAGNDVMVGGGGDDTYTGGAGADVFVFLNERGADVITDFQVGVDRISYANRSFGDREVVFTDLELIQSGDDTIVRDRGLEVTLEGVSVSDLNSDDFVF